MSERFVPAAGRRAFTRVYDPVVALTMREATFRGRLCAEVLEGLALGAPVVDVGCGTGTLAIALAAGGAQVIGVDGDPEVLALARAKPGAEAVQWRQGLATALPLAGASADRVVMSLLLHHLGADAKRAALAEAVRVLRPGGRLHVADWGRPRDPLMGVRSRTAWDWCRFPGLIPPSSRRNRFPPDLPSLGASFATAGAQRTPAPGGADPGQAP